MFRPNSITLMGQPVGNVVHGKMGDQKPSFTLKNLLCMGLFCENAPRALAGQLRGERKIGFPLPVDRKSISHVAAVDDHELAGHETAFIGCQEQRRADQIVGHLVAFEGTALQ